MSKFERISDREINNAKQYLKNLKEDYKKGLREKWQYEKAKYIFEYLTESTEQLRIYRFLYTRDPQKILQDKKNIGHFWSYEPNQYESPWGNKKDDEQTLLITGEVNKSDVNLKESIESAMNGENEVIIKGYVNIIAGDIQDEELSIIESTIKFEQYRIYVDNDVGYNLKSLEQSKEEYLKEVDS